MLESYSTHVLQILKKVGADMQVDFKLFLEKQLKGHVPLTSPGDIEGSRPFGSEGLTTPCVSVL